MSKRSIAISALGMAIAMATLVATALASNVSHPATYTGTASTGGTVEFDVSADGTAVTRFALNGVPVPPCGSVSGQTTGSIPIVNDTFSNKSGVVHFNGSFPAIQQAQGSLSFHSFGITGCTSQEVAWSAMTPTPPPDTTPANTKIKSGPSGTTHKQTATFRFSSTEAGSTFQCKLDRKPWRSCRSPKTYKGLKAGKHTFKAKAKDKAGNVDPTPAKRSWRVELD
ncbi:MAG TPA: hypothetical protein VFM51_11650 [Solirubrobacterales bacterium]|nr:hypothetical protein [Solirubrobacterales bacterium]